MDRESVKIRTEIIRFFSANPYTIDTAEGISRKIGYGDSAVTAELERLVKIGILRVERRGGKSIYSYIKPSSPTEDGSYAEEGKD